MQTGGQADVEITEGVVPAVLPEARRSGLRFQAAPGRLLLKVDGVARYLITDGRRIVFERMEGVPDEEVRLFLLSSGVGALLHQRGDLVLHGSAVATGAGAAAFLGVSGAGKSTLAAALQQRGHALLTDDLCVVRPGADGLLMVQPGPPRFKLWRDALERLRIPTDSLPRVRDRLDKRLLPLEAGFADTPLPLRRVYVLKPGNQLGLAVTELTTVEKIAALRGHTFRQQFLDGLGRRPAHFEQSIALLRQALFKRVARPQQTFELEALAGMLAADFHA